VSPKPTIPKHHWAPSTTPTPPPPTGTAPTIAAPAPNASVQGIVVLKGGMAIDKTVTKVDVRYDSAPFRPASFRPNGNTWRTLFNTIRLGVGAHTLEVRVTYSDATTRNFSIPINVVATTQIPGIAMLKLGGDAGYNSATNRDKYQMYQINQPGPGSTSDAGGRPGLSLLWNWGTTVRKSNPTYNILGVSYNECAAKGWIQKTSGGADVEYGGDPGQVFVKFGDPAYIARSIDRFCNNPNQIADDNGVFLPGIFSQYPGTDGVMTDDTNASYSASGTTQSADYPDSLTWRNAMFAFLKGFGGGIQDRGYIYGCNPNSNSNQFTGSSPGWPAWGQAHDGDQLGHWLQAMAPYVDVAMVEYFFTGGGGSGYLDSVKVLGAAANQALREYMNNVMPRVNAAGGASLLGNMQVGMTGDLGATDTNLNSAYNQARMIYLKACFYMDWDPTTGNVVDLSVPPGGYSSASDPWNASWTQDIGWPTGPRDEPVSGLFRRSYLKGSTNYIVLLNGNASGGNLTDPLSGRSVAPKTAYIGVR
jgi:hypothetical protein